MLAPFFDEAGTWIDDFCHRPDLEFRKAPYRDGMMSWHRRGPQTPLSEWWQHLRYVRSALKWHPDCIVTSFPQLALLASVLLLGRKDAPALLAWNFNLGSLENKWKGRLAGLLLKRVDRFMVHARVETSVYANWLGIPEERFNFVPLQRGRVAAKKSSPIEGPYVVSMGSAHRDYQTLVEAVFGTGIRTVIIAKRELADALPDHPDLIKLSGLSQEECIDILAGAVINVVPLHATRSAAGQVTFVTSMRMGIPTIATSCTGTRDYIEDGVTGYLVPPGDASVLRERILTLLKDDELRRRVGVAGQDYADAHLSDEAAGMTLAASIDEVLAGKRRA